MRGHSGATNAGFLSGVKNVGLLRGSLTALALEATGAAGPLGRLASAALVVAGGTTGALVAIGAIAGLAAAYRAFTEDARKAKEAQDDLNQSIDRAAKSRDPLPGLTSAAGAYTSQLERVNTELARLQKAQGTVIFQADAKSGIVTQTIVDNTKEISKLDQERLATLTRMGEVGQQLREFYASGPQARALAEAAEREARAREQAAEAAKRQLERILEIQRAIRVEAAGGGNLAQTGAVVPQAPIEIPIILRPALDREQFGTGLGDEIQAEFERAQRAARELQDLLQGVDLSLRDIGNADITGPRAAAEQLSGTILDLNRGLDAVVGASRNVGLIGDEAARAIGDVLALSDAIGQVIRQASTGNILGLVGAGIGVLGGLLGPSPAEIERNRILARNNDLLERNNAQLAVQQGGAGGLAGLGLTTAQLAAIENLEFAGRTGAKGMELGGGATDALNAILEEAGLSLKVFAAQVEAATGIELLDSKGRIVAEAFDQAKEAIDRMVEAATHFGTSLSEQDARLRARDALGLGPNAGLPTDVQALARTRELELSGLDLDAALEAKIQGLDLSTEEGRQAFLEFNRMLFTLADNGDLTAKQLGTFADVDELLGPITDAATGINALGESALDAANELSIVPKGFRSAALAFEAQIPGLTAAFPDARKIDRPLVNVEAPIDGATALDRLIPEPIQITGAELLDRLIAVGALPSTTGLPATVPGDGAALPQIAGSLNSSTAVLAQIAASLSTLRPDPAETQVTMRETNAVLARLSDLLSKAKIGQQFGDIIIPIESDSRDPHEQARDIWRALDDLRMADLGRTDPLGPS